MTLFSALMMKQGYRQNILHKEGLKAIRKTLDKREDQNISTDSLYLLAEFFFSKNSVFEHNMRYFNQLQWTVMGTKLAAPYVILFMGYLEDKTWNSFVEKPFDWWRYIYYIFMIWQHGKEKPKNTL